MGWPHSHRSEGHLGPSAMSLRWGPIQILPRAMNSFHELAGSSREYVSRAILIKCEPTSSNSTVLQVSN